MSKELLEDTKYAGKFLCAAFYDVVARPLRAIDSIVKSGKEAAEAGHKKTAAFSYGVVGIAFAAAGHALAAGTFVKTAFIFPAVFAISDLLDGNHAVFSDSERARKNYPTLTDVKDARKQQLAARAIAPQ
jgi:hypothetical protein